MIKENFSKVPEIYELYTKNTSSSSDKVSYYWSRNELVYPKHIHLICHFSSGRSKDLGYKLSTAWCKDVSRSIDKKLNYNF